MLVYYAVIKRKEVLTNDKMHELFGANYQFVELFNYDTGRLNSGGAVPKDDRIIYNNFRNILKNDARFNKNYELVAVVSLSICSYPYSNSPFVGQVVRKPRYVKPNDKFLGETGFAGTIVCRDKKTGKIATVPNKWLYTGARHCVLPGWSESSDLPGLANLIDGDAFCQDYETYEKLIRIQVLERQR